MESKAKNPASEIILDRLSSDEIIKATEDNIREMITVLKTNHSKYSSLPDEILLDDENKAKLVSPSDMNIVARNIILKNI